MADKNTPREVPQPKRIKASVPPSKIARVAPSPPKKK